MNSLHRRRRHPLDFVFQLARDSCEPMGRLINDILDFEKIESVKMSLDPEVIDLPELVERSARANDVFAASHVVMVQALVETFGLRVRADSDRLIQVIAKSFDSMTRSGTIGEIRERQRPA